jgi:hypothetical protein
LFAGLSHGGPARLHPRGDGIGTVLKGASIIAITSARTVPA